jgi:hypothetical protein
MKKQNRRVRELRDTANVSTVLLLVNPSTQEPNELESVMTQNFLAPLNYQNNSGMPS